MARRSLFLLLILALTLPLAGFQWTNQKKSKGRDTSIRNLEGIVSLPDGQPAQGAVVKLKNLKTLQVTSFVTPESGKYKFSSLSSNVDYEVRADWKELASEIRRLSVFDSRLDPIINIRLESKDKPKDDEK